MTDVPSEARVGVSVPSLDPLATDLVTAPPPDVDTPLERFLKLAVAQAGDPYDAASTEPGADNPDPGTLDCSELVQWAAGMSGVEITDGSWLQHFELIERGGTVSIEDALDTPGALLFSFDPPPTPGGGRPAHAHVAISLGDGRTIEAMSPSRGIDIANPNAGEVDERRRDSRVPRPVGRHRRRDELGRSRRRRGESAARDAGRGTTRTRDRSTASVAAAPVVDPAAVAALNANSVDTDVDMLPDHFEIKYGLDPNEADTDGDGITDGYELIVLGTEADLADSDFDGIADGLELSLGLDPTVADNPDLDAPLVAPDELLFDSDGDGITDWGEEMAGTDAADPDSDDDGVLDGDELMLDTDPLSADI